mmetsp:Transcript_20003/g.42089  ORF Transcript_20003/g.42089 Transcript_20003/m.42089 type:complete len:156 (-) Transcript_20003:214-681(-)
MVYSTLFKCSIAIILLVQASAFTLPSATTLNSVGYGRDVSCYAINKRENCPGKTAFDNKTTVGGIGGLNIGRIAPKPSKKAASSPAPKKSAPKKAAVPKKKVTKNTISDKALSTPQKTEIDWGKIILAFLTPWRNPNSIFLYLLIGVSILGEVNK